MSKRAEQIESGEAHGTTRNVCIVLDEDSKSLYAAGPTIRESVDVGGSSSSGRSMPRPVAVWEDIVRTIRL